MEIAAGQINIEVLDPGKGPPGEKGEPGKGVGTITAQYYVSDTKESLVGGQWTEETPKNWSKGKYLWRRDKITYTNPPSTDYTIPYCDSSWEAVNELQEVVDDNYFRVFGETTYRCTIGGSTKIVFYDEMENQYFYEEGGRQIVVPASALDKDEYGEIIEDKSLVADVTDIESELSNKASKQELNNYVTREVYVTDLEQKADASDVYSKKELENLMATKTALESLQTLVNLTEEQMKQMGSLLSWKDGVLTIGADNFKTRMMLNSSQLAFVDTNEKVISYVSAAGLAIPSEDTNLLTFGVYDGEISASSFRQKWKQSLQYDSTTRTYDLVFEYIG